VIDSEWITATDAVEGIATSEATDPSMLMPVRATVAGLTPRSPAGGAAANTIGVFGIH
jgi:hypothetical protein